LLAFALVLAPLSARAQVPPPAAPDADLPRIAARLNDVRALAPRAARAALEKRASAGDVPARETLAALGSRAAAAALGARLAPLDADGALRAELRNFAQTLDAARRGDAALASADKSVPQPLPVPADGDEDKQGWDNAVEVSAGAASAGGARLPATALTDQAEYNRGPWKVDLGFRALFTPDGRGAPLEGDLQADGTRVLAGNPRLRAFAGAELHRDDLMGISHDVSVHGGAEYDVLSSKKQTLTLGLGVGEGQEHHLDGQSEHHPIALAELEYELKISARAAFNEEFELEQNPLSRGDYELSSATSFIYKLSKNLAIRVAHEISSRGQPVPGYAPRRDETTIGFVLHD